MRLKMLHMHSTCRRRPPLAICYTYSRRPLPTSTHTHTLVNVTSQPREQHKYITRSHQEMVGDMSRVTLNFDP